MGKGSGSDILLQLLFLAAYTMAAAGLFLPMFSRRSRNSLRLRASGRFLQLLAITGIIPSLQVILDAIGVIDDLPRLWHPVINLMFNELILISLWGLVLSWSVLARVFNPSARMSDRLRRPGLISVSVVLAANIAAQAAALITRSPGAQLAAQYLLMMLFAILALIVIEAAARIYLPVRKKSGQAGLASLKLIPAAALISVILYTVLPSSTNLFITPLALIALLTLSVLVYTKQSAGSEPSDLARVALFEEAGMTPREREIALMLAEGLSYKEISAKLFIAISTMQTHVSRIYGKMGVNSKTELSRKLS